MATTAFKVEVLPVPEVNRFVDIRYSKDGGRNWSNWKQRSLGEVGDFLKRIRVRRMGQGIHWVFDVRVTDPVRADFIAASVQTEVSE